MTIDLEIIDYDIEGAAYRDGELVDAAYLTATIRRRATIVDNAIVEHAGDPTPMRLDVSKLAESDRVSLFAAFHTLEQLVHRHALDHYMAHAASPAALEAQIARAAHAVKEHDEARRAIEAKQAELAALDEQLAKRRAQAAEQE